MISPALDLATLPASPHQRRAALVAIASLCTIAALSLPFARLGLGAFPGLGSLYGGAVLMGLGITAAILFTQFAHSRRSSLLVLACGTLFSAIIYVPAFLAFVRASTPGAGGALAGAATYLWIAWHTALPASFVAFALLAPQPPERRVGRGVVVVAIASSVVAAAAVIEILWMLRDRLPALDDHGVYAGGTYAALAVMALLAAAALVLLLRRPQATVFEVWLTVPSAAMLIDTLLDAMGGGRYSAGWYVSRIDILAATTFLVIALLAEANRLSQVFATSERRLRGIVNGVADALIAVDARSAVTSVNPAAATLFGFAAEDLTGTPIARILPEYPGIAGDLEGSIVETVARDVRGNLFPVEFALGRDISHALGERIIILRDITQRKSAEDAIRSAHDRAIEAAEVKSQFLATMSHEIRTPINAVVGMSELMLQTPLSDEAREYASTVRDSAESLLAIVNDILDFSKMEAGHMELESVPFAPVVAVENATDILSAAARKKGLSLSTYVAPDVPRRVLGDADRLRQVLLNLLGNAVKFTSQGSVTVRAIVDSSDGDAVVLRFSVTDTGPGIAPEAAEQLFEPFRQADQSTRRRFGGTGLGLSISRRIVELMGGKIGFDSSLGYGSTFWFTIPFAFVADEPDAARGESLRGARVLVVDQDAVARQALDQYLIASGVVASSTGNPAHALDLAKAAAARRTPFDAVIVDRRAGGDAFAFAARLRNVPGLGSLPLLLVTSEEPAAATDARAGGFTAVLRKPIRQAPLYDALRGAIEGDAEEHAIAGALSAPAVEETTRDDAPREDGVLVLVVEDNPVNRKLALQQLKKLGFRAHAVTDGREAIDAVANGVYDVVLMDCQMPDVDGFEATRQIRRAEAARGGHVPIIAMTANALEGDREACLAAGMDEYLAKPVQLAGLRAAVERFAHGVGVAG